MSKPIIDAPAVSKRTERDAAWDRIAYYLSIACMTLGAAWLAVVWLYGYPRWAPTHPADFDTLAEVERARIIAKRDQTAERFVLASLAGVVRPLTAALAAIFLIVIGLAGWLRSPFLSIVATVGLSLWVFGVVFSRPPPKLLSDRKSVV